MTCVFLREHVVTSALRAECFPTSSLCVPTPPQKIPKTRTNGIDQRELWPVRAARAGRPCWLRDSQGGLRVQAARAQQARAERRARARQPAGRAAVGAAVALRGRIPPRNQPLRHVGDERGCVAHLGGGRETVRWRIAPIMCVALQRGGGASHRARRPQKLPRRLALGRRLRAARRRKDPADHHWVGEGPKEGGLPLTAASVRPPQLRFRGGRLGTRGGRVRVPRSVLNRLLFTISALNSEVAKPIRPE